MPALDVREAWSDLLRRRPAFAGALGVYGDVVDLWAATPVAVAPLAWSAEECRQRWQRGVPLLAESPSKLSTESVEPLLGPLLDLLAALRPDQRPAVERFAGAWDRREVGPSSLFPARGRLAVLDASIGLGDEAVAFLALGGLRPVLEPHLASCSDHLRAADWALGVCPSCGAPPGFAEVLDDGRRHLLCHLCGTGWIFARLRCPFCGNEEARELTRLEPEGLADQGYAIVACRRCHAYVKEVDRRTRWNAGPGLVEDWGSPHFDLVAREHGYWRPDPPITLASAGSTSGMW